MDITITGRNLELDDSLKRYICKRLDKLDRLYRRIFLCEVVLEEEKVRKNAEVILHLKRTRIVVKESSPDIYASIDNAAEKVKKRLRRLNDRLATKRRKAMLGTIMRPVARLRGAEEVAAPAGRGRIIKSNAFAGKPMLPEEAMLELELMGQNFIMFKNADTGEANVLYKRDDGNWGLIEPNF